MSLKTLSLKVLIYLQQKIFAIKNNSMMHWGNDKPPSGSFMGGLTLIKIDLCIRALNGFN